MEHKYLIVKLKGLETRPIAVLVQIASQYESTVYLEADGKRVIAKNIMGMMTMNFEGNEVITIEADGKDEDQAVEGIAAHLTGN